MFAALPADVQEAIREKQRAKKQAKQAKQARDEDDASMETAQREGEVITRTVVSQDEYFGACPNGHFRDSNLPPTDNSLGLLLDALDAGDEQAHRLGLCNYFQFAGGKPDDAWDPTFNARLAWEGFFTITASTGPRRRIEPLPELQPFYGVLLWPNFEASKHVKKTLARLRRDGRGYRLTDRAAPERTWQRIEEYHIEQHGTNWLTRRYFEMMAAASADPHVNFSLHCIELSVEAEAAEPGAAEPSVAELAEGARVRIDGLSGRTDLNGTHGVALHYVADAGRWAIRCDGSGEAGGEHVRVKAANLTVTTPPSPPPPPPVAGEIGFSVGGVYTSLSGWTGERSTSGVGTAQLVLLGRWLQRRRYAFWSLGHCYSPAMDYKRQLGHRIYTRQQFRELLGRHRGPFEVQPPDGGGGGGLAGLRPLQPGDACAEEELLAGA